ncbi:hypothetical protein [Nocardiopsis sp. MG754419]|uniref:hypothetical protein n=1 Tax=Nocardiopsis sp. MG754419 TaxID=2259865 RepID=UPI001BACD6C6|nr:hypothetical protein [Nocardiopsis sp. MG754419]MBR8744979.1 hypothetical protein [Nocardiopsis sp. MG754419]
METTFIALTLIGLVLLGLAVGFFLAISIGIRRQDSRGRYRSLRDDDDDSALSHTGRYVCGLRFRADETDPETDALPTDDRTPTAV